MAMFKLYDCEVGFTIRGVNYVLDHVDSVTVDDPETNELIRGANAGNKIGLTYKQGLKEAKTMTTSALSLPMALHNLLKEVFNSQERIDFYAISRTDGSSKMARNAILASSPKQLTLDDSAESLQVQLMVKSYDMDEVHKS